MKKIQCIIKVTNGCNLRCKYCYNSAKGFKSDVITLDKIEKTFDLFEGFDVIQIIFHGGEPMLGGMEFYEKVLELERIVTARRGTMFENLIQTNATLIDARWISFFKKNNFFVGISFDGLENEKYRGHTEDVLKSLELMRKNGLRTSAIAVVSNPNYDIGANYDYFKSLRLGVDFAIVYNEGSAKEMDIMSPDEYGRQMVELFDRWVYDKDGVPVRNLVYMLKKVLHCCREYCGNGSCVGNFFCVDVDGSLYGCSHETVKQYRFGNIADFTCHHDIINAPNFKRYVLGSIERRRICMDACPYFDYCKGGCADDALLSGDISKPNKAYCRQFQLMFDRAKAFVDEMFEKKTPLSELNPVFKEILAEAAGTDDTVK